MIWACRLGHLFFGDSASARGCVHFEVLSGSTLGSVCALCFLAMGIIFFDKYPQLLSVSCLLLFRPWGELGSLVWTAGKQTAEHEEFWLQSTHFAPPQSLQNILKVG